MSEDLPRAEGGGSAPDTIKHGLRDFLNSEDIIEEHLSQQAPDRAMDPGTQGDPGNQDSSEGEGESEAESEGWDIFNICSYLPLPFICDDESASPLLLDLDGDGVEAGGIAYFDHAGDGFKELSRWVGADDAVLVRDLDGNGKIDGGHEIFGDQTMLSGGGKAADGFVALADLDSNGDGAVDSSDRDWSSLRLMVWSDSDGDGEKDSLVLQTLATHGINSLGTTGATSDHVDAYGNEHRLVGSFTKSDGTAGVMSDVWLRVNNHFTVYDNTSIPDHSDEISALPDIVASGRVHDLRDAMALDASGSLAPPWYGDSRNETRTLGQLVKAFKDESDVAVRDTLAESILLRWSGAEGAVASDFWQGRSSLSSYSDLTAMYAPDSTTPFVGPRQIAVIEAFQGFQWLPNDTYRNPTRETARKINAGYQYYLEGLRAELMFQTHLAPLLAAVSAETDDDGGSTYDFSGLSTLGGADGVMHKELMRAFMAAGQDGWLLERMRESSSNLTATFATYRHGLQRHLLGGSGADSLHGSHMLDSFDARTGGDDNLYGYGGNDVYWLGAGTGNDVVREGHLNNGDDGDVIRLKPGEAAGDISISRDREHLYVRLLDDDGEVTDSLKVHGHFTNASARVEAVELADGTVLFDADDLNRVLIRGGEGNDRLYGAGLDDHFDSDAGGNDGLYGAGGNDEYRLGSGTGADVIYEGYDDRGYQRSAAGEDGDLIRVESGHSVSDVRLRRDKRHLWVELLGAADGEGARPVTDSLKVYDYFEHVNARVESVAFSDGTTWGSAEFLAVALRGGAGDERVFGRGDMDDIFDADAGGDDSLYGAGGNDEYRLGSGTGADVIYEGYDDRGYHDSGESGSGDLIRVESGHSASDVRLRRDNNHLWVELLGEADGEGARPVTDSLKVYDYFERTDARVESVVFSDGTTWGSAEFRAVALRGGTGDDRVYGRGDMDDIFDADAGGNDRLYGAGGNDEYRLGSGTGADVIYEGYDDRGYQDSGEGGSGDLVRVESGHSASDVRLRRDKNHLWVELLGEADGEGARPVTDSLKVYDYFERTDARVESVVFSDGTTWGSAEFRAVALRGGTGDDRVYGRGDMDDIFDADAGGNDRLYGAGGNDEYRLGSGTGADVIYEGYDDRGYQDSGEGGSGDLVRVESGHSASDVRLRRDKNHLWVELLGEADGEGARPVTDSLKVYDYFERTDARVESVVFSDGTTWGSAEFRAVALRGGTGDDRVYGRGDMDDIFDADAGGNDRLYGAGGNDEYRLGSGTGADVIYEGYDDRGYQDSGEGGSGDLVRVESGHSASDVRLRRDNNHLWVELLGEADGEGARPVTDSLKVYDYFERADARVESVVFSGGTEWGGNFVVGTDAANALASSTAQDVLHGGLGDDTYTVSGSFGSDRIVDSGGTDKAVVSGHAASALSFSREGDDLVMGVLGSDDRLSFDGWYAEGGSRRVERIEAGGRVLLAASAERMAIAMSAFVSGGGTASDFVSGSHQDYWEAISGPPAA